LKFGIWVMVSANADRTLIASPEPPNSELLDPTPL